MSNRKVPFNDADYLHKLSPEDRAYYQQFIAEHYFGRRPKDRSKAILDQDTQREAWREQNAQRRDAQWRATFEPIEIETNPLSLLIRIYDTLHLPLEYETVFGDLMDEKLKKEIEVTLDMVDTALDVVGDYTGKVKTSAKQIQCFNWLMHLKSDLEKKLTEKA